MNQATLDFSIPRAHVGDPITSFMAADRAEESGQSQRHRDIVLATVRAHPGSTSRELSRNCVLNRWEVARRLPDLRNRSLVYNEVDADGELLKRECAVAHSLAIVWHPARREKERP